MAKRRSAEELHEIYLKCAELMHTEGEKAVLNYLETEEHYVTPNSTWFYIQKNEEFKKAEKEYKEGRRTKMDMQETKEEEMVATDAEARKEEQIELEVTVERVEKLAEMLDGGKTEELKQEKPPVWLMPRNVWEEIRMQDIMAAMKRYVDAKMMFPMAWCLELNELIMSYNLREKEVSGE